MSESCDDNNVSILSSRQKTSKKPIRKGLQDTPLLRSWYLLCSSESREGLDKWTWSEMYVPFPVGIFPKLLQIVGC